MEFESNSELYEAIEEFRIDLDLSGLENAGSLISEGISGLNGLTDGWAHFLEYLDTAKQQYGVNFSEPQNTLFSKIRGAVHKMVHRA